MAVDPNFLKFQHNMRTTALGVSFGRKLFTDPDSISSKQLVEVMKALGMNIPKEVEMTVQAAQAITTGTAIVEQYQTAEDVQSVTSTSAASIKALNQIGHHNGWIDDDTSSAIKIGVSAAQIYASGGMDVSAWVSLASEFYVTDLRLSAQAQTLAQKNVIGAVKGMLTAQGEALGAAATNLLQGKTSPFGLMVEAASGSPALFSNVIGQNPSMKFIRDLFPGLEFLPQLEMTLRSEVSISNWWGQTQSGSFQYVLKTLPTLSRAEAVDFLFTRLIEPTAWRFLTAEQSLKAAGKMKLTDFLILNTLEMKSFNLSPEAYFLNMMVKHRLTLHDFGFLLSLRSDVRADEALNFSGKSVAAKNQLPMSVIRAAERSGRLEVLSKDKDARTEIEKFLSVASFPLAQEVRDLNNYMAVLNFMDMVVDSGIEEVKSSEVVNKYLELGTSQDFAMKLDHVQKISTLRKVNILAAANVAFFLGAKNPAQIQNVSGLRENEGSVFRRVV